MNYKLSRICSEFCFEGTFNTAAPYGDGHINDTFKVEYVNNGEIVNYILQRINHQIFKNPVGLMNNIKNVTTYFGDMLTNIEGDDIYTSLELINTIGGKSYLIDNDGNYWRSYAFVEDATGHLFADTPKMLYHAAKAFGHFQRMLKDFPADTLIETLPEFHNTVSRFNIFEKSLELDKACRRTKCVNEVAFVIERKPIVATIVELLESGELPLRVTHNDTKINNVLLDNKTGLARCVIDLDTVMPGSALYDFGDSIRSSASTALEDEEDLNKVKLDVERFRAFTKGFLEEVGNDLTLKEIELLPIAGIMMTYECGIRFLTDYLDGDQYFKVHKTDHNLIRAKNQFKFVEEMEQNLSILESVVVELMNSLELNL